jgi:hypothetical protein
MRRWVLWPGLVILLTGAALGTGAPLSPEKRAFEGRVEGYGDSNYWRTFQGGIRAKAIALGKTGEGYLGLFVFDPHGNCVAHDHSVTGRSRDDAAVEWLPAQTGLYTIEVRALGRIGSDYLMAVRQGGS